MRLSEKLGMGHATFLCLILIFMICERKFYILKKKDFIRTLVPTHNLFESEFNDFWLKIAFDYIELINGH